MLRRLIIGVVAASALVGCGTPSSAPVSPSSSSSPTAAVRLPCKGADKQGGTPVRFGPANDIAGISFGAGAVGIVFAHEANDTSCSWLRTAATFAKRGYRTLIFDFAGFGASPEHAATYDQDVSAAAAYLRSEGATSVVLIGASMGGTASLIAASKITPQVAGVVALSAPVVYGAMGALGTILPPTMPALLMAGSLDGEFPSDARSLHGAIGPGQHRTLVLLDSSLHGFRLVAVDGSPPLKAKEELDSFLARHAPAT